jgi:hypothetical protein
MAYRKLSVWRKRVESKGWYIHATTPRVVQPPAHYEVELRQPSRGNGRTETAWRAIRRVGPDGTMQPLRFATTQAAQAHAERLKPKETRLVAVERDGWRRVVDEAGT